MGMLKLHKAFSAFLLVYEAAEDSVDYSAGGVCGSDVTLLAQLQNPRYLLDIVLTFHGQIIKICESIQHKDICCTNLRFLLLSRLGVVFAIMWRL